MVSKDCDLCIGKSLGEITIEFYSINCLPSALVYLANVDWMLLVPTNW